MKSWLIAVAVAAGLAGCSGGGSNTCSGGTVPIGGGSGSSSGCGTGTVPTPSPTITVTTSSATVTSAAPATITATVADENGAAVAGVVVDFSVTATVGALSATAALTDTSGHASVLLSPATGANSGADAVVASVTVDGTAVTGQVGYQLSAVSAAFDTFTVDALAGGSSDARLVAYGQTQLTLTLTGVSAASPAALVVTSDCVSKGKASISPASVTNTTGSATFIYKDTGGCGSVVDKDTVTASITGSSVTPATTSVYLTSPTVNSITFDSATPSLIFLKGSGYAESSSVKFKVVDTAGNPLPNQSVGLTMSTYAGGLTLDQLPAAGTSPPAAGVPLETKKSDADGFVTAIVNSGTVPTPVRVIATLDSGVTTVSSLLVIATGLPAQRNFSLSQSTINIEGYNIDGAQNTYTVRAADRSGNPVPDDTAVVFWSETGGQIHASGTTSLVNGIAQATSAFESGGARPLDGRVTIVAYAIGEESFVDLNGNNVWDTDEPFGDLGDVLKDLQYDNHFDNSWDEFVSLGELDSSAQTTCKTFAAYPQFTLDRTTPSVPGTCSGTWSGKTYVRQATETVLSSSHPRPFWYSASTGTTGEGLDGGSCTTVPLRDAPAYRIDSTGTVSGTNSYYNILPATTLDVNLAQVSSVGDSVWWTGGNLDGTVEILLADDNPIRLNPMPAGTTITAATSTDNFAVGIVGGSPVPNSSAATPFFLQYKSTGAMIGNVSITVKTPSGLATTFPVTLNLHQRGSVCP